MSECNFNSIRCMPRNRCIFCPLTDCRSAAELHREVEVLSIHGVWVTEARDAGARNIEKKRTLFMSAILFSSDTKMQYF